MHKYFVDWYRAAGLQPTAQELEARWQAVEAMTEKLQLNDALDLVRIFYDLPTNSTETCEHYRASLKAEDPTFSMRGNAIELKVLAGATIAHIVENTRTRLTDVVALGMKCGLCRGLRKTILNEDIVDFAKSYLMNESVMVRDAATSFEIRKPDTDLSELLETLTTAVAGNNLTTIKEQLRPPFEKLANAILSLASSVDEMAQALTDVISLRREESDILWWVFGGNSRDLKKPMSELALPFAALVAGKEFADLVRAIPAPLASDAFLDRMLARNQEDTTSTTIKDAVNASSPEWRTLLINQPLANGVSDLCPIHLSIQMSSEPNNQRSWHTRFNRDTGIKSGAAVSPLNIAIQICDERMLKRAIKTTNGE